MSKTRNMQSVGPEEFVRERFVPTVVYVRESKGFHTRLCVYNYFSELFPDVRTGATVYVWFFTQSGKVAGTREFHLPYRGQLQYDLAELKEDLEGTAGLSMVPDTIPEFRARRAGTGYYVFYYDDAGHADFSHEWEPMRFERMQSEPWLCVIRPLLFPDTELIVMSAYYGMDEVEGSTEWTVRIRNSQGTVLAERKMTPIPPRGSIRLPLHAIFPDVSAIARQAGTIGIEAVGSNIQGPFTFIRSRSGDFNIHHFC